MGLFAVYQPIVDLAGGVFVIGYEALIRGNEGGRELRPSELFAHAHAYGAGTTDLDFRARVIALEGAAQAGIELSHTRLWLNLSASTLLTVHPDEWMPRGAPLDRLVLEISERSDTGRLQQCLPWINDWRKAGLQVALDDYGAERTCLHTLDLLQPEYVKLDLSFVARRQWRVIRSVRRLLEDWPSRYLVEGVATAQDAREVMDCGVRYAQGFYYGRPTRQVKINGEGAAQDGNAIGRHWDHTSNRRG